MASPVVGLRATSSTARVLLHGFMALALACAHGERSGALRARRLVARNIDTPSQITKVAEDHANLTVAAANASAAISEANAAVAAAPTATSALVLSQAVRDRMAVLSGEISKARLEMNALGGTVGSIALHLGRAEKDLASLEGMARANRQRLEYLSYLDAGYRRERDNATSGLDVMNATISIVENAAKNVSFDDKTGSNPLVARVEAVEKTMEGFMPGSDDMPAGKDYKRIQEVETAVNSYKEQVLFKVGEAVEPLLPPLFDVRRGLLSNLSNATGNPLNDAPLQASPPCDKKDDEDGYELSDDGAAE